MGDPQRRGAKVVDAVLEATVLDFARVGFAGLSIEDIAARAGVAKTTVYRRWPDKIALVRDALLESSRRHSADIDTGHVKTDILAHVGRSAASLRTPEGKSIAIALLADEPAITSLARDLRLQSESSLRALVERGIARKQLSRNIDIHLLIDSVSGAVFQSFFFARERVTDDHLRQLIEVAIAGVEATARDR